MDRPREAAEVLHRLLVLEPRFSVLEALNRSPLSRPEDIARYAEGLRRAGLREDAGSLLEKPATPATPPKQAGLFEKSTDPAPSPLFEIQKRLAEAKIRPEDFLRLLIEFGFIEEKHREDIAAGYFSLANVKTEYLKAALADWQTVIENVNRS